MSVASSVNQSVRQIELDETLIAEELDEVREADEGVVARHLPLVQRDIQTVKIQGKTMTPQMTSVRRQHEQPIALARSCRPR